MLTGQGACKRLSAAVRGTGEGKTYRSTRCECNEEVTVSARIGKLCDCNDVFYNF